MRGRRKRRSVWGLRPYSWIDLLLYAPLARAIVGPRPVSGVGDVTVELLLFLQWLGFNAALERTHRYSTRGQLSRFAVTSFFAAAGLIALSRSSTLFFLVVLGALGALLYGRKSSDQVWCALSALVR